jgi:protein-disulfide isomerase
MKSVLVVSCCVLLACGPRPAPASPNAATKTAAGSVKLPTHERVPQGAPVERIYELARTPAAPTLGGREAKVTVEVCSDFQCPYCAQIAPTLRELNENYGELVRIVWRNCPLPFHERAMPAAEAAMEVHAQQGNAAFWAYHDQLFSHQGSLDDATLISLAGELPGVDVARVRAALKDHRHEQHVKGELMGLIDSGAASSGLGTPTVFVNGRMLTGAEPYRTFEDAVEKALQEPPEARARAETESREAYPMARVRHILVQYAGARGADPGMTRSHAEAKARAEALRLRLAKERDFAAMAREESDCASAPDGGALGRFTRGELDPSFELALFALEPGQTSEVVETPFGFHILLREE